MAFPGHSKSLQLSHVTSTSNRGINKRPVEQKRDRIIPQRAQVTDDRGNRPTPSLWVGNIPLDLATQSLDTTFARYGPLKSTKKIRGTKYAFVNFEDINDAITALECCHGSQLFEPGCVVHVRFTGSENEAKHAKGHFLTCKKVSQVAAPPIQQGQMSQEIFTPADPIWPNGQPPSGPKIGRRNSSLSTIRKSDSYRPSDRSDQERQFSHSSRVSASEKDQRGHDVYRPSYKDVHEGPQFVDFKIRPNGSTDSDNFPLSCSPTSSLPSGDRVPSTLSERYESAPYSPPVDIPPPILVDTDILESPRSDIAGKPFFFDGSPTHKILLSEYNLKRKCMENEELTISTPCRTVRTPADKHALFIDTAPVEVARFSPVTSPAMYPSPERGLIGEATETVRSRKYRVLSPLQRLRCANDDASSSVSDCTTSTKSSVRRKKCADCKKPESSMMVLIACLSCSRKFHISCGDPRPSLGDQATYTCGKCLRKQDRKVLAEVRPPSHQADILETVIAVESMQKKQLTIFSQVDGSYDEQTALPSELNPLRSPCQPASQSHLHVVADSSISCSERSAMDTNDQSILRESKTYETQVTKPTDTVFTAQPTSKAVKKLAQKTKEAYKRMVTCPWWMKDNARGCSLKEPDCMFAHRETGIHSPDGHSVAKKWTCRRWYVTKDCPHSQEQCLYAHKVKDLHVGSDGKASKKHITCHWWAINGRCKHSEIECLFTHQDTGLYARAPGSVTHSYPSTTPASNVAKIRQGSLDNTPERNFSNVIRTTLQTLRTEHPPNVDRTGATQAQVYRANSQVVNLPESQIHSRPRYVAEAASHNKVDGIGEFAENAPLPDDSKIEIRSIIIDSKKEFEATQDPRKVKRVRIEAPDLQRPRSPFTTSKDSTQPQTSQIACQDSRSDRTTSTENNLRVSQIDRKISNRTKKCKSCAKTIFSGDICVGCKPAAVDRPSESVPPMIMEENREDEHTVIDTRGDRGEVLTIHEHDMDDQAEVTMTEMKQLKRRASQDAMFVSSKRSRPNPNTIVSRYRPSSKPQQDATTRESGNAVIERRKLQQLLSREDAIEIVSVPPVESNKENRRPAHLTDCSATTSPTDLDSATQQSFTITDLQVDDTTDAVYDSPRIAVLRETSPVVVPGETISVESRVSADDASMVAKDSNPQTEVTLENPDADIGQHVVAIGEPTKEPSTSNDRSVACRECSKKHMRCIHSKTNVKPAVTDSCQLCREKHKKCLHGPEGELDGKKCFDWLQIRGSRGASDRNRIEQVTIYAAAQRYEAESFAAQSRESSVSSFSVSEESQNLTEDNEDEISTAATSHTERETNEHMSVQVQKHSEVTQSEYRDQIDAQEISVTCVQKSTKRSLSLLETIEEQDASTSGTPTVKISSARHTWSDKISEEDPITIQKMKSLGIRFEVESEDDDDEPIPIRGRPTPTISRSEVRVDPLHQRDQLWSKDLYRLFPESDPNRDKATVQIPNEKVPSITKSQGLKNRELLRRRSLLRNLHMNGHANWEVDRRVPDAVVSALVEDTVAPSQGTRFRDRYAPESVETRVLQITFSKFLGVSEDVEPCLVGKGSDATLAFREIPKANKRDSWLFGKRRRTGEAEKWPVHDK